MKINDLKAKKADIINSLRTLADSAETLTADQEQRFQTLKTEV